MKLLSLTIAAAMAILVGACAPPPVPGPNPGGEFAITLLANQFPSPTTNVYLLLDLPDATAPWSVPAATEVIDGGLCPAEGLDITASVDDTIEPAFTPGERDDLHIVICSKKVAELFPF